MMKFRRWKKMIVMLVVATMFLQSVVVHAEDLPPAPVQTVQTGETADSSAVDNADDPSLPAPEPIEVTMGDPAADGAPAPEVPAGDGTPATEVPVGDGTPETVTDALIPDSIPVPEEADVLAPGEEAVNSDSDLNPVTDPVDGEAPEGVPAEVQAFLDAVAFLPSADEVTEENAKEIGEKVNEVLDRWDIMSAENSERDDVQAALGDVYAVYEAVLKAENVGISRPLALTGSSLFDTTYHIYSEDRNLVYEFAYGLVKLDIDVPVGGTVVDEGVMRINDKGYDIYEVVDWSGFNIWSTNENVLKIRTEKNGKTLKIIYEGVGEGTANIKVGFHLSTVSKGEFGFAGVGNPGAAACGDVQIGKVSVSEPSEPGAPRKPNTNEINCWSDTQALGIRAACSTNTSEHKKAFWPVTVATYPDSYSLGRVVKNTGSNAEQYPWTCTLTVNNDWWANRYSTYNAQNWPYNYGTHRVDTEKTGTLTSTFYWNGSKWVNLDSKILTVWVTCKPTAPTANILGDAYVKVQCSNAAAHQAGGKNVATYSLANNPGGWTASAVMPTDSSDDPFYSAGVKWKSVLTLNNSYWANKYDPTNHELDTSSTGTVTITAYWYNNKWAFNSQDNVRTVYVKEVAKKITNIEKKLVKTAEEVAATGLTVTDITYPNTEGKIVIPNDSSVKLLYKITVSGDTGAAYKVTDNKATYVGGNAMEGTIPESGFAVIYVTREFTASDINSDGNLVNSAFVTPGKDGAANSSSTETTPAERKPDKPTKEKAAEILNGKYKVTVKCTTEDRKHTLSEKSYSITAAEIIGIGEVKYENGKWKVEVNTTKNTFIDKFKAEPEVNREHDGKSGGWGIKLTWNGNGWTYDGSGTKEIETACHPETEWTVKWMKGYKVKTTAANGRPTTALDTTPVKTMTLNSVTTPIVPESDYPEDATMQALLTDSVFKGWYEPVVDEENRTITITAKWETTLNHKDNYLKSFEGVDGSKVTDDFKVDITVTDLVTNEVLATGTITKSSNFRATVEFNYVLEHGYKVTTVESNYEINGYIFKSNANHETIQEAEMTTEGLLGSAGAPIILNKYEEIPKTPKIEVKKSNNGFSVDEETGNAKVDYTVTIKNVSGFTIYGLRLTDTLTPTLTKTGAGEGTPEATYTFSNWKVDKKTIEPISGEATDMTHVLGLLARNDEFADQQTVTLTYTVEIETNNVPAKVKLDNEAKVDSWSAMYQQPKARMAARANDPYPDDPDIHGTGNSTTGDANIGGSGSSTTEGELPAKYTLTYQWNLPEGADPAKTLPTDKLNSRPAKSHFNVDTDNKQGDEVTGSDGKTYVFSGWTVPDDIKTDEKGYVMPAKDVVITGTWTEKVTQITVTWKDENETELHEETVDEDKVPEAEKYTELTGKENPTKDEDDNNTYEFSGWDESTDDDGNVTYTAKYDAIPKKVTLSYDANGGTNAPEAQTQNKKDNKFTVEEQGNMSRTGYRFLGWKTDKDAVDADIVYAPNETVTLDSDLTLYAVWEAIPYTVTYTDGVEGEEVFADQTTNNLTYGTATPEFDGTPSRDGYTFAGWTPEVADTVTGSVIYTAQWTLITVTPTPANPTPVPPTPEEPTPDVPTPEDPTPEEPTPVVPAPVAAVVPAPVVTPVEPTPVEPTPVEPEVEPEDQESLEIEDQNLPLASGENEEAEPVIEIEEEAMPLAEGNGAKWALINFALMNLAIFESLMLLIGYFIKTKDDEDEDEKKLKKKGIFRILSVPVAVISLIAFILTEDITLPTGFVDKYTILMLIIAIVQTVAVALSKKKYEDEEKNA